MIRFRDAAGLKPVGKVRIRTPAGLVEIGAIRSRDAAGLKTYLTAAGQGALAATVQPMSAYGGRLSSTATDVPTEQVTVTATGGREPYAYAWAKLTGDASWSCDNPGLATTRFRRSGVEPGLTYTSTWRCTVTDGANATTTVDVPATAENLGDPRGNP